MYFCRGIDGNGYFSISKEEFEKALSILNKDDFSITIKTIKPNEG